jgi:hypothetical protein
MNPLKIPDSMKAAFGWATGLLALGGVGAAVFRNRMANASIRVYAFGVPATLVTILLLAFAVRFAFPNSAPSSASRRRPDAFIVGLTFEPVPGSHSPNQLDVTYNKPSMPTSKPIPITRAHDNLFESSFPFPEPDNYFSGWLAREVTVAFHDGEKGKPTTFTTPIRFQRAASDPPVETKGLALFNCIEITGCKPAADTPTPGWVDFMASLFRSAFPGVVYAK